MGRDLADIIAELSKAKRTGMLSIGLKGGASLFKMFFREGAVYHITHGASRNLECLSDMSRLEMDSGFFLPDARVDAAAPLAASTEDIIAQVRDLGKIVNWSTSPMASQPQATGASMADPRAVASLEEELVNLVGPVGTMLIERVYAECGAKRGRPLTKTEFRKLVECVIKQLPENQRQHLADKFL